ncbi:MAG: hypothetical protein ABUL60_25530 [Myxococcales bacterium]
MTPVVAFDGAEGLVVYLDYQNGTADAVVARRVGADGVPVGPAFDVRVTATPVDRPKVVFDGNAFIVSWTEVDADPLFYHYYFARVTKQGAILTAAKEIEKVNSIPFGTISAGELGTLALVCRSTCNAWLITPDDQLVQGAELARTGGGEPKLGYSDGVWLAALSDTELVQIGADAQPIEGSAVTFAEPRFVFSEIAAPDGFLIAWQTPSQLGFTSVGFDASVADVGALFPPAQHTFYNPTLVAIANGYAVSYVDRNSDPGCGGCQSLVGRVQLLSPQFTPVAPDYSVSLGGFDLGLVSSTAGDALLVRPSVLCSALKLTDTITAGGTSVVSVRSGGVNAPHVAPAKDGWLVAWGEDELSAAPQMSIRGQLVDASGSPSGEPFVIYSDAQTGVADVRRGPNGWLVSAVRSGNSLLLHLSDELEVSPVESPSSGLGTVITGSSDGWLALWCTAEASGVLVHARRYEQHGGSLGDVELGNATHCDIAAAADGGSYGVTWLRDEQELVSALLPASGDVGAVQPDTVVVGEPYFVQRAAITATSEDWLTSWANRDGLGYRWSQGPTTEVLASRSRVLPLVSVGRLAITGLAGPAPLASIELVWAEPGGQLIEGGFVEGQDFDLSEPFQQLLLVAFTHEVRSSGSWTRRLGWQVVEVQDDYVPPLTGTGGDGGGAGAAGAAGAASAGEAAAAGAAVSSGGGPTDGGETNGGARANVGGMSQSENPVNDGGGAENGGAVEPSSYPPRTSSACGCRTVGQRSPIGAPAGLLALALLALRARRRGALRLVPSSGYTATRLRPPRLAAYKSSSAR